MSVQQALSHSRATGKSIEWLCMEDCQLSRLLALTVLVLNGSMFRNLTLVSLTGQADLPPALSQAHRDVGRHTQLP